MATNRLDARAAASDLGPGRMLGVRSRSKDARARQKPRAEHRWRPPVPMLGRGGPQADLTQADLDPVSASTLAKAPPFNARAAARAH